MNCKNKNSYKINRFRYFRRDFAKPPLSIDIKICSFLKHSIHRRSLSSEKTAMYDIFYEMFCCSQITKASADVFFLIFILQNIFSANAFKTLSNQQNRARRLIHVRNVTCDHNLFLYQIQNSSKPCHC